MKKSTIGMLLKVPAWLLMLGAILGGTYVSLIMHDTRVTTGTVITLWIIGILYVSGIIYERSKNQES